MRNDSREFFTKSTCFCIQSYRCSFGESSMRMISKNIVLLWIEVSSFNECDRIVIPHELENREPSHEIPQIHHVQGFSTRRDTSMTNKEAQTATKVYKRTIDTE